MIPLRYPILTKMAAFLLILCLCAGGVFAVQITGNDYSVNSYFGNGGSSEYTGDAHMQSGLSQVQIADLSGSDFEAQVGLYYFAVEAAQAAFIAPPSTPIFSFVLTAGIEWIKAVNWTAT